MHVLRTGKVYRCTMAEVKIYNIFNFSGKLMMYHE